MQCGRVRLELHICDFTLGGSLYRAPIKLEIQQILDLGRGPERGVWIWQSMAYTAYPVFRRHLLNSMAASFPRLLLPVCLALDLNISGCRPSIVGMDLSPIQPEW